MLHAQLFPSSCLLYGSIIAVVALPARSQSKASSAFAYEA